MATSLKNDPVPDLDEFRLRRFVDRMVAEGEVDVVEEPIELADLAGRMDGNEKAVLFRQAGPEKAGMVRLRRSVSHHRWIQSQVEI